MGNPTARSAGWLRIPNAAAGIEAMGIYTKDSAERVPYVFGLGDDDTGRISTSSRAGAALTFPDTYGFGEAWELRWTFAETGNSQRQGIFGNVRGSAANSSTIRGIEFGTEQEGNVAIGVLEGANFWAGTRGASGNITNMFGLTGEFKHNASYAGTITAAAALRAKFSFDNAATYTLGSVLRLEMEPTAGGGAINSLIYGVTAAAGCTVNYLIDTSGIESTNYSANRVVLWKFKDSAGTDQFLIFDADAATSVLVDTNETE